MADFRTTKKFVSSGPAADAYVDQFLARTDGVDTIFAKDINDLFDSVVEIQKSIIDGYATTFHLAQAIPFEEGQALVYEGGILRAGASGDSSFKLQSISTPTLTVKGGYLILDDGYELATFNGTTAGTDFAVNLTTVLGTTPANATCYYLYVDRSLLGALQTASSGRQYYHVAQGQLALSTSKPYDMNPSRYYPLGFIETATSGNAWSGTGAEFGTLATRRHSRAATTVNPIVYTLSGITKASYPVNTLLTHNAGVPTANQQWIAQVQGADGYIFQPSADWLVNVVSANAIRVDFSWLDSSDTATIRLMDLGMSPNVIPAKSYDSGAVAANALTLPINHGLPELPTAVSMMVEVSSGVWQHVDPASFISVTSTQFTGSLSALGSSRVRIVASSGQLALSVLPASSADAGIVTTAAQTFAGAKTFSDALTMSGGLRQAVRTATATGALNATDNFVIVAPASANATMTLPAHAAGLTITVKRNSASFLVYVAPGSGTIDGASSYTLGANFQAATFVSNGTNWFVI